MKDVINGRLAFVGLMSKHGPEHNGTGVGLPSRHRPGSSFPFIGGPDRADPNYNPFLSQPLGLIPTFPVFFFFSNWNDNFNDVSQMYKKASSPET